MHMTVVVAVVSLVAAIATALAATVVYVSALKVVASTIVSEGALVGASLHHRNGSISGTSCGSMFLLYH